MFLVGPNASGKSNFLDAFRFLRDVVSVGGGLEEAVRRRGGISRLRCLAARNPSDVVIDVHLGRDDNEAAWAYELRWTQDRRQRPIIEKERVQKPGRPKTSSPMETLRLLGLLWVVLDGVGPLLLEEPELSLHPEVVRFIPQMFARMQRRSGRQVMVSTHSTDLLRDEGIGLDEVLLLLPARSARGKVWNIDEPPVGFWPVDPAPRRSTYGREPATNGVPAGRLWPYPKRRGE